MKIKRILTVVLVLTVMTVVGCGFGKMKKDYKTAAVDLKLISAGCETYELGKGEYPKTSTIEELKKLMEPEYMGNCPLLDPWGNKYLYKCEGNKYYVASAGSDGKFEGFHQKGTYTYLDGKDIIYVSAEPVYCFKR